jgi:hypothetical protein
MLRRSMASQSVVGELQAASAVKTAPHRASRVEFAERDTTREG